MKETREDDPTVEEIIAARRTKKNTHLTVVQKLVLGGESMRLSALGFTNREIARRLEISADTVPRLLKFVVDRNAQDADIALERSKEHHKRLIRECWRQLSRTDLPVNSMARGSLMQTAQASQKELDKLEGVEKLEPVQRVNVAHTLQEAARDYEERRERGEVGLRLVK